MQFNCLLLFLQSLEFVLYLVPKIDRAAEVNGSRRLAWLSAGRRHVDDTWLRPIGHRTTYWELKFSYEIKSDGNRRDWHFSC
mgnify:CR=1 FL=1|jgi:hypothetical protein